MENMVNKNQMSSNVELVLEWLNTNNYGNHKITNIAPKLISDLINKNKLEYDPIDITKEFIELLDTNEFITDENLLSYYNDFINNKVLRSKFNLEGNLLFISNDDESLKKITKTTEITNLEVLTDEGYVEIKNLHETIPYDVYELTLSDGRTLKCADNHIVFNENMEEVFIKDLEVGDRILVENNEKSIVVNVESLGYKEVMYDLELTEESNRRYYTNGILSHNTHLAKKLAEYTFGDPDALIRFDMSEFGEKFAVSRLIGAPPGYVGHESGGELTEKVRRRPYSIILFDEIEKANRDVYSLLLQLLDDGQLTDSLGRKVNFKNCMVIMTSNTGVKKLQDFGGGIGFNTSSANQDTLKSDILIKELKKEFPPEFLNRIDDVIIFKSLSKEDIGKIIDLEFVKLRERILELGYDIKMNKTIKDFLCEVGYDEEYGARPLTRAIQKYVEDPVSEEILKGNVQKGQVLKLSYMKSKDKVHIKVEDK